MITGENALLCDKDHAALRCRFYLSLLLSKREFEIKSFFSLLISMIMYFRVETQKLNTGTPNKQNTEYKLSRYYIEDIQIFC